MNFDQDFSEVCTKRPINNIPALIQTMAWRRPGKPPMMASLLMHICVTQFQWEKRRTADDMVWYTSALHSDVVDSHAPV